MARQMISTIIGKGVKKVARLRGGGSALPGLVIEKIDPKFIQRTLKDLPQGVVIISGTNGKTTTTKIVVELLESVGLRVFTNRTGSNFSRGVAAALLDEVNLRGKLEADIAVLELDEAWAVKFVQMVRPRFSLLLNVMRDQLDRFGEIDNTASLLQKIAEATTDAVVLNRDDPRIFKISKHIQAKKVFFGTTDELLKLMPTDDNLKYGAAIANQSVNVDVLLKKISGQEATLRIDNKEAAVNLKLTGVYNLLNAAAATALARQITGPEVTDTILSALENIKPAFGRGETIFLNGTPIELILVKNPSGFRLALLSFAKNSSATMIAVNDNFADGRDVSWFWDVDFSSLKKVAMISGVRAYDMALRLQYDEVAVEKIDTDITRALDDFINDRPEEPKQIFCSYTAMTAIRRLLSEKTDVEEIL
ncbi:MurT ligase domain-containing protein [Candidatus Nanosynbacter sp. TM7-074]|uniref:Lipid II isoglutaminyl synthase (glutamine-hydrolyzing) subunit MurT n=1 Tax=Candidatus Nanosynbacter sp. TM7-074 TaxID=3158573 RepID=A0AB39J8V1_9BACT